MNTQSGNWWPERKESNDAKEPVVVVTPKIGLWPPEQRNKLARKLAEYAKELLKGMQRRVHRDPDIADFESGFRILLEKEK